MVTAIIVAGGLITAVVVYRFAFHKKTVKFNDECCPDQYSDEYVQAMQEAYGTR